MNYTNFLMIAASRIEAAVMDTAELLGSRRARQDYRRLYREATEITVALMEGLLTQAVVVVALCSPLLSSHHTAANAPTTSTPIAALESGEAMEDRHFEELRRFLTDGLEEEVGAMKEPPAPRVLIAPPPQITALLEPSEMIRARHRIELQQRLNFPPAPAPEATVLDYEKMALPQLRELVAQRNLNIKARAKQPLIDALRADDAGRVATKPHRGSGRKPAPKKKVSLA